MNLLSVVTPPSIYHLVRIFNFVRSDSAVFNHFGTYHIDKVPFRWVYQYSQCASLCLGPFVIPAGESFAIIHHPVGEYDGVSHDVVVLQPVS